MQFAAANMTCRLPWGRQQNKPCRSAALFRKLSCHHGSLYPHLVAHSAALQTQLITGLQIALSWTNIQNITRKNGLKKIYLPVLEMEVQHQPAVFQLSIHATLQRHWKNKKKRLWLIRNSASTCMVIWISNIQIAGHSGSCSPFKLKKAHIWYFQQFMHIKRSTILVCVLHVKNQVFKGQDHTH